MDEVRELLSQPRSTGGSTDADVIVNEINQMLGENRLGHRSGTDTCGRAPPLELDSVKSVLESGGIAKLYCTHPDGVKVSTVASLNDLAVAPNETCIRGGCLVRESRPGSRRYLVVRLAADGAAKDQTDIKLQLVREVILDLHGVQGTISAQLDRSDTTGIVALRGCAFAPQASTVSLSAVLPLRMPADQPCPLIIRTDLSDFEQPWQSLLQPLGCTLVPNSTAVALGCNTDANRCFFAATAEDGTAVGTISVRRADDNEALATKLHCVETDCEPVVTALLKAVADWCRDREIRLLSAELMSSSGSQIRLLHSLGFVTVAHHLSFARRL
jgi:hypothetical protein